MRAEDIFKKTPPMLLHRVEVTLAWPLDEEGIEIFSNARCGEGEVSRRTTMVTPPNTTNVSLLLDRIVAPRAARVRLGYDNHYPCDELASLGEDLAAGVKFAVPYLVRSDQRVSLCISVPHHDGGITKLGTVPTYKDFDLGQRIGYLKEQRILVCELWGLFLTDAQAQDLLARHEGP